MPAAAPKGIRNGNATIPDDMVRVAIKLREGGMMYKKISGWLFQGKVPITTIRCWCDGSNRVDVFEEPREA